MAGSTRAALAAKAAGIPREIREYDYDAGADAIGIKAAQAPGLSQPESLFTT